MPLACLCVRVSLSFHRSVFCVYGHLFPSNTIIICQPFAPRSLLASSLLRSTPPSINPSPGSYDCGRLFPNTTYPCGDLWTSQVPRQISTGSPTFQIPLRENDSVFPDLVPAILYCLLTYSSHQLSHCVFRDYFRSPYASWVSARQFRYLRFADFVTYVSARLAIQRNRFSFCNGTFTHKICQTSSWRTNSYIFYMNDSHHTIIYRQ